LGRHPAGLCGHLPHQTGGLRRTGPLAEQPAHGPRVRRHHGGAAVGFDGDEYGTNLVLDARLAALAAAAAAAAGLVRWWG
jgi:hypothetical protein